MANTPVRDTVTPMSTHDLELFGYHVTVLSRDSGKFGLSFGNRHVDVEVRERSFEPTLKGQENVWDSVTMDGHSVGNRQGAVKAYARFVAGETDWWRAV